MMYAGTLPLCLGALSNLQVLDLSSNGLGRLSGFSGKLFIIHGVAHTLLHTMGLATSAHRTISFAALQC